MNNQIWLDLVKEEVIEPEIRICDSHHHFWLYPDSRYLAEEFANDLSSGHLVSESVFVECNQFYRIEGPEKLKSLGETEFVDSLAIKTGTSDCNIAAGIVGFVDLNLGSAVEEVIQLHIHKSKRFCGVRHATAWDASAEIRNAHTKPEPELLSDVIFREGLTCLSKHGLVFDAWLYHPQISELTDLARAMPDLNIVLDHVGCPLGIGPYAGKRDNVLEDWFSKMTDLATCKNVSVKLGGLTMPLVGLGWHKNDRPPSSAQIAEVNGDCLRRVIDLFGPDRCMFESNFPVDRGSCSYTVLWNAFKLISKSYSKSERQALFREAAVKTYKLQV
ncbi:MAG: amidohydrolase family protein [Halieaceae bacterium]|nr:amidohydrolase family protein [Halieaceae bacterium]